MRPWEAHSDGDLLRLAREGDGEAFGEFYGRHEAIVAGFLAKRTRDPGLTADLTAETFASALLRSKQFRDEGQSAIGWLLGITRNLLLRTWERGRTERRACQRLEVELVTLTDASIERIDALLDSSSPTNPLTIALKALPEAEREAVRKRVLDEQAYEELARDLGVSQSTARQRVSRGLARMRTTLEGRRP